MSFIDWLNKLLSALQSVAKIGGVVVVGLLSSPANADNAQAQPVQSKAETYTSSGQTSGCGLSFLGTGVTDGGNSLGLSGSANVLWVQDQRKVTTMVKVGALVDLKPVVIRKAWIETQDQKRSQHWSTHQTGNPPMLLMVKDGDFGLYQVPLIRTAVPNRAIRST